MDLMLALPVGRLRAALLVLTVAACALMSLAAAPIASAHDAAENPQRCTSARDAVGWARTECWAPSTAYPAVEGWYGIAGRPGSCGFQPISNYFGTGYVGAQCLVQATVETFRWTGTSWVAKRIAVGREGYLAPYQGASQWRWLYVTGADAGWYAIAASDVGIRWAI
ncbi:MAG: hypothetical protein JWN72_989 [Thermoleophilia bacterium]|nr:hypothetical protein [Thermoleophilia bacterium]